MTRPLKTVDSNSQEQPPSYDHDNAPGTRKRPVTVPSLDNEQYSASSTRVHFVSNMPDTSSSTPLFDPCCLSSPLQTLARTLEASSNGCFTTIDVAQAYQSLYNRLRASAHLLVDRNEGANASQLQSNIPTLVQCLKRDLSEGLQFFSHVQPTSSGRPSSTDSSFSGIEGPEIQMSIDSSLLCQSALHVTSALWVLPALHTFLSDADKATLLHPIVEICVENSLPIFDHKKIQQLALSCLRTEVACGSLVPSQRMGVVKTISHALDLHDLADTQTHALKNLQAFLRRDAFHFIGPCLSTLPKVLDLLPTSSGICRVEVVNTLCSFATAKCQILDSLPDTVTSMSTNVHEFLAKQKSRKKSVGGEHLLPGILKDAIKGDGAIWALTSLASFVILGDAHIFSRPRSLKLVFDALRYSSRHKIPAVAILHTEVWKCLVWVLSRSFAVQDETHIASRKDTYQRAFQMLTQEMRPTVGTCLVAVLMQDHSLGDETFRAWNVREAVSIIKQLVEHTSPQHFLEGYALLHRMVGNISSPGGTVSVPSPSHFVRDAVIDGSWLSVSLPNLGEVKKQHSFPLSHLRRLTEAEVQTHWKYLSESWATSVEHLQSALTTETLGELTEIWQTLLLSQAHLTQCQTHFTASSPFAANFASLITRPLSAVARPDERVRQLGLVRRWWNVLKNVFDRPWLSVPAGIVLTGLLEKQVDLSIDKVQDPWSELCFELISTVIPTFLHLLHTRVVNEKHENAESASNYNTETHLLWVLYVRHCVQVDRDQSWTDLAALLSLPFQYAATLAEVGALLSILRSCDTWTLSDKELDMWSQGLVVMLLAAGRDSVDEVKATLHMVEQLNDHKRDSIIVTLFETVLADPTKLPISRQLLQLLDERLLGWYSARNAATALRTMRALGRFWKIEEPPELISTVALVQKGVSTWLLDLRAYVSNVEHAKMIDSVFIPALECLPSCGTSGPDILTTLETLFISVFAKPSPLGADSFLTFFRSHYHRLPNLSALCPERLFTAVKSYADLCNEPLEGDISILTPSSPSTVVSDSQSPRKHFSPHEYSHFGEFRDPVGRGFELLGSRGGPQSQSDGPEIATTPIVAASDLPPNVQFSTPGTTRGEKLPHGITSPPPNVFLDSPGIPIAPSRRAPKRHHTGGYFEISGNETIESPRPLKRTKTVSGPLRSPTTSNQLSSPYESHVYQRPTQAALASSSLPPSSDPELGLVPEGEDEDDYDSWEAGISHKDIQALRDELNYEGEVLEDADSYILHDSSSPTGFPFRSRMRERSQTAPEPSPQSPLLDEDEPFAQGALRRHHTSGSFEQDDNTQLNAVRHAYATMVDSGGVSQMGIEGLMQMKRLTSRIGQTVDEHIEQQLEKEGRLTGASGKERSGSPF